MKKRLFIPMSVSSDNTINDLVQTTETPAECNNTTTENASAMMQCSDSSEIKINDAVTPVYTPSVDFSYTSSSEVFSGWSSTD